MLKKEAKRILFANSISGSYFTSYVRNEPFLVDLEKKLVPTCFIIGLFVTEFKEQVIYFRIF